MTVPVTFRHGTNDGRAAVLVTVPINGVDHLRLCHTTISGGDGRDARDLDALLAGQLQPRGVGVLQASWGTCFTGELGDVCETKLRAGRLQDAACGRGRPTHVGTLMLMPRVQRLMRLCT